MWYFFLALVIVLALLLLGCYGIFRKLIWRQNPKSKTGWFSRLAHKVIKGGTDPEGFEEAQNAAEERLAALSPERVTLTAPDGATLVAHILAPAVANDRLIVACHGMGCTGLREFCFLAPDFYEKGYTLLMPDHRGCGESDGNYMGFGTHESKDTFLWVQYAKERFPDKKIFLLGVSMGAATVLMMSRRSGMKDVCGVIADCSYTTAWDEFAEQLRASFHLPAFPILHICDFYCRLFCNYSFHSAAPIEAVKKARKPILFIHGADDLLVPPYMQEQLYEACSAEKFSIRIDGAPHARSYYINPDLYTKAVEAFMTQVLRPKTLNIPMED